MKHYEIATNAKTPEVTLKIPTHLLRDLVLRAEENGNSVEVELAVRLARTLEHDLAMIEEDNQLAYAAFEKVSQAEVK